MNLEIREDSKYTFRFEKWIGRAPESITAASLRIFSPGGIELLPAQAMTTASNVATKEIDFAADPAPGSFVLYRNYRAEMTIDGVIHNRLFDLVKYPFVNEVTDNDLVNEWDGIAALAATKRGEADSGAVDSVTDSDRNEADDYWKGGSIIFFPLQNSGKASNHTVTGNVFSTNTVEFDPPRDVAPAAGQQYTIRRNFQNEIRVAGEIVAADLWKKERRLALVLDGTQVSRLVVYKVLERFLGNMVRGDKSEWIPMYERYLGLYSQEFDSLPLEYDSSEYGVPESVPAMGSISMIR